MQVKRPHCFNWYQLHCLLLQCMLSFWLPFCSARDSNHFNKIKTSVKPLTFLFFTTSLCSPVPFYQQHPHHSLRHHCSSLLIREPSEPTFLYIVPEYYFLQLLITMFNSSKSVMNHTVQ